MPLLASGELSSGGSSPSSTSSLGETFVKTKKRKRNSEALGELEVDVNAPEPPSKKALRKAKKSKAVPATASAELPETNSIGGSPTEHDEAQRRSGHGVWIGNLPWSATKPDLKTFLTTNTKITDKMITRIHIPVPSDRPASRRNLKPQNKGFAYVDFSSEDSVAQAVALTEKLMTGRRLLIKDSKSFEGRPVKKDESATVSKAQSRKPPNKRIFVGNLTFDTEKEDLQAHFAHCGDVTDVHMATFEDSGKCKGFAWVTFQDLNDAEAAVRGWVTLKSEADNDDEEVKEGADDAENKQRNKPKERKWWVNRLKGRQLRMEFAEDAVLRYKKRYGKESHAKKDPANATSMESTPARSNVDDSKSASTNPRADPRSDRPFKKVDARTIKPGAALSSAPRVTSGIVASQGKKTIFD